jgi:hypothetical protein
MFGNITGDGIAIGRRTWSGRIACAVATARGVISHHANVIADILDASGNTWGR